MMSVRQSKEVGEIELLLFFCRLNHDIGCNNHRQIGLYTGFYTRFYTGPAFEDSFRQASTCCKASQGDTYGSKVVEMLLSLRVSLLDVLTVRRESKLMASEAKLRNLQVHKVDQTEDDVEVVFSCKNMLQHFVKANHRAIMRDFFEKGL